MEQENKMKNFYKKWWFWTIIVIITIILVCFGVRSKNIITSVNTVDNIEESLIERKKYEETQEYNGTYSFIQNDNSSGNTFFAIGAISFDGDVCKVKYIKSKTSTMTEDIELEGTCGLNKEDMSTFYFTIYTNKNKEVCTYKCSKSEKNLVGELISEYNLTGCNTNKKIDLVYVNNTQETNVVFDEITRQEKEKREEEEKLKKQQEEKEFKESCKTYTFEQIARNPNNFKGTNVKLTGEVVQVIEGLYSNSLRVNITKKGTYSTYYTDTVYVNYVLEEGEDKILENDIITLYGTSQGDYSYTSTIGSTVTLPLIFAKYITIEK